MTTPLTNRGVPINQEGTCPLWRSTADEDPRRPRRDPGGGRRRDAGDVTDEKSFIDDLDVDSLSMVEVAMAAEEKFGVKIPDDELANLKTVGDAVSYIETND